MKVRKVKKSEKSEKWITVCFSWLFCFWFPPLVTLCCSPDIFYLSLYFGAKQVTHSRFWWLVAENQLPAVTGNNESNERGQPQGVSQKETCVCGNQSSRPLCTNIWHLSWHTACEEHFAELSLTVTFSSRSNTAKMIFPLCLLLLHVQSWQPHCFPSACTQHFTKTI